MIASKNYQLCLKIASSFRYPPPLGPVEEMVVNDRPWKRSNSLTDITVINTLTLKGK